MTDRTTRIAAGIISPSPGWELLLEQIGIDWFTVTDLRTITPELCSLVICNRDADDHEMQALRSYAASGGAVLFTFAAGAILSTVGKRSMIGSLPPAEYPDHWFTEVLDLYSPAWLFDGGRLIKSGIVGKGSIGYCGADIERILTEDASARRGFIAERDRLPHERVARRCKAPIRQLVMSHMEYLHHQRKLPFVHKWFYPREKQSLFTFRIDSDKGTQAEVDEIAVLSERFNVPTTWFLDVKSHETWLQHFRSFVHQEIGVHCYDHSISRSPVLNKENFERALHLLQKNGLHPVGIAAPTGAWNVNVGTAIRDLGFLYSSEFSYDYDNLPSFPRLNGLRSPVVQLPVHPTCIGTMRRERMSHEEMVRYFTAVVDRKLALREPVCLYHHPGHRSNDVFEEVFQYIRDKNSVMMPYKEYAAWWNRRDVCTVHTEYAHEHLQIRSSSAADDTFLRISIAGGKEAFTAPVSTVDIRSLPFRTIPAHPALVKDIMRTRAWRPGHFLQNALDWWITTTE